MVNSPPTTHRIQQFNNWNKGNELILNPPYQRNPIWSPKNKSYMIDSVLENFPIPEIFIQVKTTPDGCVKYYVVDGQQRIRAILDFIEGKFKILDSESEKYGGKSFQDLDSKTKAKFWDFQIVTREIITPNEEDVKIIFKRMNKYVVPLKPQEIRNATYGGQFIELATTLADTDFWSENKIVSPEDIRRMTDIEFVSELIISVLLNTAETKKHESIDKYYRIYDDKFHESDEIERKFNATIKIIDEIMSDLRLTRWNRKNEFYSLFLAFIQLIDNYAILPEKYSDIKETLCNFSNEIQAVVGLDKSQEANLFIDALSAHTTNKEQRNVRTDIVKNLILPFLIVKDNARNFTDEQRQLKWNQSKDKLCVICDKTIEWSDYHLDHITSHSKGGKTILSNAQITHNKCNQSKSNR